MNKTIILAADHAGFKLKEAVRAYLQDKGYTVLDVGAHGYVEGDDYPEYMIAAAMKVASDLKGDTKAVLFGRSGQGEAIVANRFPGVRAVVWYGDTTDNVGREDVIKLSREHNDANILSIGAAFVKEETVGPAIDRWLTTTFSGEDRHKRRIQQIDNIE